MVDANYCCLTRTTGVVKMPPMALGSNIKRLREAKAWTQTELGVKAMLGENGQQIINALEKRDSKSSSYAPAIAHALGVSLEELLSGSPTNRSNEARAVLTIVENPEEPSPRSISDQMMTLLAVSQQLTPDALDAVLDFARSMAKQSEVRWRLVADNQT